MLAVGTGSARAQTGCGTTVAIAFGAHPTTGTIAAGGETGCFAFSGAAGDRVRVRMVALSGSLNPLTEVVSPQVAA